jgi:hypothetical protein
MEAHPRIAHLIEGCLVMIVGSVVTMVFGFLFWLYKPEQVNEIISQCFQWLHDPNALPVIILSLAFCIPVLALWIPKLSGSRAVKLSITAAIPLIFIFLLRFHSLGTYFSPQLTSSALPNERHPLPECKYPKTLWISPVTSGQGPSSEETWLEFKKDLANNLKRYFNAGWIPQVISVRVITNLPNNTEQLSQLQSNTAHIFALGAGTTATAVQDLRYHYVPRFVLTDTTGGPFMYEATFIVNKDTSANVSTVEDLADLLNRETDSQPMGLGNSTSLSSMWITALVLEELRGKELTECKTLSIGSHRDLMKAVADGGICGACVASDIYDHSTVKHLVRPLGWQRKRGRVSPIWTVLTNSFPSVSFGWRADTPVPLQFCIEETFTTHDWSGDTSFKAAYNGGRHEVGGVAPLTNYFGLWTNVIEIKQYFEKKHPNLMSR